MIKMIKNKRAAMEMSVGTIVTIVLLMAVLVLGLILIRSIFKTSQNSVSSLDEGIRNQIDEMFTKDSLTPIVIAPGRSVSIKKGGEDSGFAFSIRNTEKDQGVFKYDITATQIETSCANSLSKAVANTFISLGREDSGIIIPAGNIMANPILVKFNIPESAPPCEIRYRLNIERNEKQYTFIDVDVKIISK